MRLLVISGRRALWRLGGFVHGSQRYGNGIVVDGGNFSIDSVILRVCMATPCQRNQAEQGEKKTEDAFMQANHHPFWEKISKV